jgi:anti-sigma regulatory factor (Ser/Thr protein kinase)
MGQLRIALRAYAAEGHHPDAVLSRASRFLHGINDLDPGADPRFATCLYIEVDPGTGLLDIARAGHPDPAIRLADGTMMVRPTAGGLPLGIDADADYPTTRMVLEPDETMLVCTDGLIETGGHDLETGWARLRQIVEGHDLAGGGSLELLADALVQAVHGPPSHHTTGPLADRREDDIAVLLLAREGDSCAVGPGAGPVRRTVLTVAQAEPERIAQTRRQVRDLMHDWADADQVDSAVLMVSELVTNVLVHTDGDALLIAEISGPHGARRIRVAVSDGSDELPHVRQPGEMASSGRGLVLMELLAAQWGVAPQGEGKSIWFELYEGAPVSPSPEPPELSASSESSEPPEPEGVPAA